MYERMNEWKCVVEVSAMEVRPFSVDVACQDASKLCMQLQVQYNRI